MKLLIYNEDTGRFDIEYPEAIVGWNSGIYIIDALYNDNNIADVTRFVNQANTHKSQSKIKKMYAKFREENK